MECSTVEKHTLKPKSSSRNQLTNYDSGFRASFAIMVTPKTMSLMSFHIKLIVLSMLKCICLAGSTLTTFTSVLPISLQRISTRRCQSRCSYSRGALQSTQFARVCTILLSTMPCQWVYPPFHFCLAALAEHQTLVARFSAGGTKEIEKEWKRQIEWNPHFISTCYSLQDRLYERDWQHSWSTDHSVQSLSLYLKM